MDALLLSLREVSVLILPTLGALVLIFLLVLLKQTFDLFKRVNLMMDRVNKTMDVVDKELAELQVSLGVISGLARGILTVQDFTKQSLTTLAIFLGENIGAIKEWLRGIFSKSKDEKVDETDLSFDDQEEPTGL